MGKLAREDLIELRAYYVDRTTTRLRAGLNPSNTIPALLVGPDELLCGRCGDWLYPEDIEGHLNAEGRSTRPHTYQDAAQKEAAGG